MKNTIFKIIRSTVFIVMGVISLIGCFNIYFDGWYSSHETYGGDAYTGIQNAAADAADNIIELGRLLQNSMKFIFAIAAVFFIAFGVLGIIEVIMARKRSDGKYVTQIIETDPENTDTAMNQPQSGDTVN